MRDDLQLVKKIEGVHVCHAFLTPPPLLTTTADRISVLFFWATAAVECFTPTPFIPCISLIKQPRSV
jgi:hypothetical protein